MPPVEEMKNEKAAAGGDSQNSYGLDVVWYNLAARLIHCTVTCRYVSRPLPVADTGSDT
jgi:hypothetical protein